MTNSQKAAIEEADKLPTAEETLYTYHPIGRDDELSTDLWPDDTVLMAMNEHTAAHTAALRDQISDLERENNNYRLVYDSVVKNRDELRERVFTLQAKIASYESAIDGLKKVVDSLYNLRS